MATAATERKNGNGTWQRYNGTAQHNSEMAEWQQNAGN